LSAAINHWVHIQNGVMTAKGMPVIDFDGTNPASLYDKLQYSYPKFFKMDILSKWAWLGAEYLLTTGRSSLYERINKNKIALMLMTSQGSMDIDRKYSESMKEIASPALFVYTLPNIMLGEICIRHGFKGEQLCMVSEEFDVKETEFWVNDVLHNRGMDACLCGWADATSISYDVCLFWVTKQQDISFSAAAMQQIHNTSKAGNS
jgi:hypothetical protein